MSGTPGQGVQAVQGQTYGEGVAQENLQRAMPAPNVQPMRAPAQPTQAPQPAQSVRQPMSIDEVQKMVAGIGGTLNAPDDRPNVPFTTGLPLGPDGMVSPSMSSRRFKTLETFRQLTVSTGDPIFSELADRMGL
jgi:hypothetical protein